MGQEKTDWVRELGKRVREVRFKAGLSQAQFSRALGFSNQSFISRLERGELVSFSVAHLWALLHHGLENGLSADQLLFGRDPLAEVSDEKLMTEAGRRGMALWFHEPCIAKRLKLLRADAGMGRPHLIEGLDLLIEVAEWVDDSGISLLWLLTGRGSMLTKGAGRDE